MKSISRILSTAALVIVGLSTMLGDVSARKVLLESTFVNEGHPELSSPLV